MHAEVVKIGETGSYAVDLLIGGERFRVHYFEAHRVNPMEDARKFAAKIGEAVEAESQVIK